MTHELNPPLTAREREIGEELRSRTNVANAIASHRIDRGLTQDELGRRAGTKQSRISEIESLQGNVRFDTLDRIARKLNLMITLVPRVETVAKVETETTARPYGRRLKLKRDDYACSSSLVIPILEYWRTEVFEIDSIG